MKFMKRMKNNERIHESDLKKFKTPLNIENTINTSKTCKSKINQDIALKSRNDVPKKRFESVIENSLPTLMDRSESPNGTKIQKQAMLSTISPFESLTKSYSRAVIEELFKGNHNHSTIANSKFPSIPFGKQTSRKSLVNMKENPHEGRFDNIDRFPSILSSNKRTNSIVGWDQGKRTSKSKKASKEWLVNQLLKEKKGYVHKFKKVDLLKQNKNHLYL